MLQSSAAHRLPKAARESPPPFQCDQPKQAGCGRSLAAFEGAGGSTVLGTSVVASYGLRDWLELGAIGFDVQNDGQSIVAGPMLRGRLLKDQGARPEVSLGAYSLEGVDALQRRTVFIAASKRFPLFSEEQWVRAFRLHAGFRNTWREVGETDDAVGYVGAELEFPRNFFAVGEVSTEDNAAPHTPFSFGVQYRDTSGFGLSLAGIQTGTSNDIGLFVGIGINFDF